MCEKHAEDAQGRRYLLRHLSDEFVESTARLLNSEWPRSLAQRCESLRALISSKNTDDSLLRIPISLILVELDSQKVIGHASLVSICVLDRDENDQDKSASSKNLVFLQSLLVDPDERGKGIGKLLMRLVEDYLIEYRFV